MIDKIKSQERHFDIIEEQLFDALVQLKKLREEHQLIIEAHDED